MWKDLLLSTYYHATLPMRNWLARKRAREGQAPISILFYHRVADTCPNDWTMSRDMFAQQIAWLRERFDLISLAQAQERIVCGVNYRPAVCITFDDGYRENCEFALPLLVQERIPCTYFVSSWFVGENQPFPHDCLRGEPLPPNTIEDLRSMVKEGIEIGAHTRTHADLGTIHDPQRLQEEVVGCAHELEDWVGAPIRYFAFPYGLHPNLNAEAFRLARRAGYAGACSAYGGYNFPGDDAFHLQRIHADPEMLRLKNWLTVDPRKQRRVQRFEYEVAPPPPRDYEDYLPPSQRTRASQV
ncbi:MAG TPA: polysaccharide deacetylase family protein [Pirellulaceae bacterium]|nr:polysaccharide deacetylase family protein [Pirellulaceae bacterium]